MLPEDLPDDVKDQLAAYRKEVEKSFKQEFQVEDSKLAGARVATRDGLADLGPLALTTLADIMHDGESEASRLKAATYTLDKILGKDTVLDPEDPTLKLIGKLTAQPASDEELDDAE